MRRTPAASSPATVNDLPGIPAMKLNGFAIAAHTAFTARAEGFRYGNTELDDTIKRLQAYEKAGADRVVKFGVAVPEAFGARGEHERKSEFARRCHGGGDALGRLADVEQRFVLSACGREVLDRRSDEAYGCGVATGLGHVIRGGAEAAFEICRDRKIDR